MRCPTCKKEIDEPRDDQPLPKYFPFCCERCKLIDLGRWLNGKYQIPLVDHRGDDDQEKISHG
jgi:endogenous inhibitor of DNA gyrase (YacG/DUF329 family)